MSGLYSLLVSITIPKINDDALFHYSYNKILVVVVVSVFAIVSHVKHELNKVTITEPAVTAPNITSRAQNQCPKYVIAIISVKGMKRKVAINIK